MANAAWEVKVPAETRVAGKLWKGKLKESFYLDR